MAVHREFASAANDPGIWDDYGTDVDTGKKIEVLWRAIPAADEEMLRRKAGLWHSKQTVRFRGKGASEVDIEVEKEKVLARMRAAFALLGTRNWGVLIGDEPTAQAYAALCPGATIELGKELVLDPYWTNDALKAHYFEEHSDFATWILGKVDAGRTKTLERQEELRGNS